MPQRDDEYIRSLLMQMEGSDSWLWVCSLSLDMDDDQQKEFYHLKLLVDQGFVASQGKSNDAFRLTAQGHDYLDAIRDDGIWRKTKAGAAQVGGASLGILKDIATAYIRREAAERLGLPL